MHYVKVIDNIAKSITRDGVAELGEEYEKTDDLERADAILVRASDIHDLKFGPNLLVVARSGAGVNNIPLEKCAERGIVVFNAPGANSNAVKELVAGLILTNSRDTWDGMNWVIDHRNDPNVVKDAEKNKKAFVGQEVIGRTVGVIGLGAVGSKVANALVALGMDVYGYDPYLSVEHAWQLDRAVKRVDTLDDVCRGMQYLTVHVPSKEDTQHMISTHQLDLLAPDAMLLNYARADIIDEDAVGAALESGKLSKFICDFATPKTVKMPRTLITPHMGACTGEAEDNCAHMVIGEMKDYLENGTIRNSVNYPACDFGPVKEGCRIALLHKNIPGMIGQISSILGNTTVNIQHMTNEAQGAHAYTLLDTTTPLDQNTVKALGKIGGIYRIRIITPTKC
ncbi:3-phosphoglycerate dehydrogenase family protein [Atopobium sp. oral taxon 416]|uniref:3-phosphoglycerate dehydrogenase family protein n=1 Tax=Atopobium sp. oral taxon 416 TaxID=712157 RepID=UPI001BA4A630|nr:3-phosphoglycerate dehydrogenase family protein [Atopobium sp. oral taxon 416]QUC02351.1 3-phosphoglycerate dehydrogenase [Atopobium sp. oral taxon 416]